MSWRRAILVALLAAVAAAGCGGGTSATARRSTSTTTTTAASTTTTIHSTTAPLPPAGTGRCITATAPALDPYLGLTLAAAQGRARSEHRTIRVVGTDGTCAVVTLEYSSSRVDVELANGVVITAEIG